MGNSPKKHQKSEKGEVRVVMLGNGGVGKSALTFRFIQNKFLDTYNPTIEDSFRKQIRVDTQPVLLDILDTAGQDEYQELREVYMRGGEGFVIVYSITDMKSFKEILSFKEKLSRVKDSRNIPVVVVGNKIDLEDEREVSQEDIKKLQQEFPTIPFCNITREGKLQ